MCRAEPLTVAHCSHNTANSAGIMDRYWHPVNHSFPLQLRALGDVFTVLIYRIQADETNLFLPLSRPCFNISAATSEAGWALSLSSLHMVIVLPFPSLRPGAWVCKCFCSLGCHASTVSLSFPWFSCCSSWLAPFFFLPHVPALLPPYTMLLLKQHFCF